MKIIRVGELDVSVKDNHFKNYQQKIRKKNISATGDSMMKNVNERYHMVIWLKFEQILVHQRRT